MNRNTLTIDPEKPPKREHWYYACVRCGRINDEYSAFGGGSLDRPRYYCRGRCIPAAFPCPRVVARAAQPMTITKREGHHPKAAVATVAEWRDADKENRA